MFSLNAKADPASNEAIQSRWDCFAPNYSAHMTVWSRPVLATLLASLQLGDCKKGLVEVGVGPGSEMATVKALLPDGVRYVATDFSPKMVDIARAHAPRDVVVEVADGQDLGQFESGSFDRYLSNLCLMIVPNTDAMLLEANRVLADGGIACFSMWGEADKSPMQTMVTRVTKEILGEAKSGRDKTVGGRSNFHLGSDDAALRARVLKAGFTKCVVWHQHAALAVLTGHAFAQQRMVLGVPSAEDVRNSLGDKFDAVFAEVARRADEMLARGQSLGLDTVIVVAQK